MRLDEVRRAVGAHGDVGVERDDALAVLLRGGGPSAGPTARIIATAAERTAHERGLPQPRRHPVIPVGKPEHALGDDVALDLPRAAEDRLRA